MTWKRKTCGAAHLKSPSWYLPKACRMMVMTAMMGLTTQNWRVAWRTHYNSEWDIQKKKKIKDTVEKEEDEGWWGTSEPVCTQPLLTDRVSESLSPVVISHHNHYSDTYVEVNTWTCIHTIVKTCRCSEQIANLTYESLLHDSSWYKHLYTLFIQTLVRLSCILL